MNKLKFKLHIQCTLLLKTGLHIGGSEVDLDIGGADNEVVKVKVNKEKRVPYIPGSSLKGKLRSLIAHHFGYKHSDLIAAKRDIEYYMKRNKATTDLIDHGTLALLFAGHPFRVKVMNKKQKYVLNENEMNKTKNNYQLTQKTRLIVRDSYLKDTASFDSEINLEDKAENVINRITGGAQPRHMERVVKGTEFEIDMIMDIYKHDDDKELLKTLLIGLQMLGYDYLGGSGTRGYGKVEIYESRIDKITFNGNGTIKIENSPPEYSFFKIGA